MLWIQLNNSKLNGELGVLAIKRMTAPSTADRLEGWRRFLGSAWVRYGLILLVPAAFLAAGMAGVVSLTRAERLRAVTQI